MSNTNRGPTSSIGRSIGEKFDFLVAVLANPAFRNCTSRKKNPLANPLHVAVLVRLVDRFNAEYGYSFTAESTIAAELACGRASVHRAIAKWVRLGFLDVVQRGGPQQVARYAPCFAPLYREDGSAPLYREDGSAPPHTGERLRSAPYRGAERNERSTSEVSNGTGPRSAPAAPSGDGTASRAPKGHGMAKAVGKDVDPAMAYLTGRR